MGGACYSKLNYSLLLVSIYLVCRSKERIARILLHFILILNIGRNLFRVIS